jgi:hypothetical protein
MGMIDWVRAVLKHHAISAGLRETVEQNARAADELDRAVREVLKK